MRAVLVLGMLWICSCLALSTEHALKKLHGRKSIEHNDCTVSLQVYTTIRDRLLCSLEIVNTEDVYESQSKVGMIVHIITYLYDPQGADVSGPLNCIDKTSHKVFSSLIRNDRAGTKDGPIVDAPETVEADHGPQDGVNNRHVDPFVNVLARVIAGRIYVRGVIMEFKEGITGDDVWKDNFQMEMDIPIIDSEAAVDTKAGPSYKIPLIVLAMAVLLVTFIMNSHAYKMTI